MEGGGKRMEREEKANKAWKKENKFTRYRVFFLGKKLLTRGNMKTVRAVH
jgi:hypothetical protein